MRKENFNSWKTQKVYVVDKNANKLLNDREKVEREIQARIKCVLYKGQQNRNISLKTCISVENALEIALLFVDAVCTVVSCDSASFEYKIT